MRAPRWRCWPRLRGWVRRRVRHAASAVDGVRDAPDAAPLVPLQLGRARKDFVLRSHDAAKGEVLWPCGATSCWPSGTRSRPEEFVPERSVGDDSARLLQHLLLVQWVGDRAAGAKE